MPTTSTRAATTGRPRAADVEQRTRALIAVAEAALIELGYEGATLSLIAARAKVSKKTIYAKFGGKPGLLRAVLQHMADRFMEPDFDLLNREDPVEGLYQWARMILRINQTPASHAITAIAMREGRHFPEFNEAMVEARRVHQQAPLRNYLQSLQARGLIRPIDCDEVASTMLWILAEDMLWSVSTGTAQTQSDEAVDLKARRLATLIGHGLLVRHEPPSDRCDGKSA